MKVACVGSGPASYLIGVALKKGQRNHSVTIFETSMPTDEDLGVAFLMPPSRNIAAEIETLVGTPLPLYRWESAAVIRQGAETMIAGSLGSGMAAAQLRSTLADAAKESGCDIVSPNHGFSEADRGLFELVVIDATSLPRSQDDFQREVATGRIQSISYLASGLIADRVFEAVQTAYGLFFGHGFAIAPDRAVFTVEAASVCWKAREQANDRRTLGDFISDAFAHSLKGVALEGDSNLHDFTTVRHGSWRIRNRVLIGTSAMAAAPSSSFRCQLAFGDALELAAALSSEKNVDSACDRYEKRRRPVAASATRTADALAHWTETLHRYIGFAPLQFSFATLTRSLRVNYRDLEHVSPSFVKRVDQHFAGEADGANEAARQPMFVPFSLRGLALENRIGVSPMCMYMAKDGTVDDFHLVHIGSRAMGGAGLVFVEMTDVSPEGRCTHGCAGLYKPEHVDAWRRVVGYVHGHTRAKIAMQLAHAGRRASTALPWEGGPSKPALEGGWEALGPSAVSWGGTLPRPREMTPNDMDKVVEDFVRATKWSEEAGFDLLELHMAHGYLLSSFLSPLSNRREDEFGGTLRNRARFPMEVTRAVREAWPAEKPLSVRIAAVDWAPGGSTFEDMIEFCYMIKEAGVDIVDVSTGNVVDVRRPTTGRLFQTPFSDQIRNEVKIPTMTVGRLASYGDINSILAGGRADICLLAKEHLYNPYFTHHAAQAAGYGGVAWPSSYAKDARPTLREEF